VNFRLKVNSPAISMFFISLMLILPFLIPHRPYPIQTFYLEWLTAVFAFVAFIPLLNIKAWSAYKAPTIIVLPVAMLGFMAVQYVALDIAYWQQYFLVAQYFLFAALMMLLGAMLKDTLGFDKAIKVIACALLISGLLSVLIIALDIMDIHLGGWVVTRKVGGAVANLGQSNHLATLLGLALASLGYLYVRQSIKSLVTWTLAIVLLAGLALTASRSTWLYVSLLPLTALIYRSFTAKNTNLTSISNKRLVMLLIVPALYFFTQLALPYIPANTPISTTNQRLVELAQTKDSPRLLLYKASWYIFADNPFLGTGFGQMAGHDLNHASRVPELKGTTSQAHNTLLQLLAETGVIGTTLVLVCLLAFFVCAKSAPLTPERWLWWLCLLIIGTHAMLEYPLWYMHYLALTALLLGMGDMRMVNINKRYTQLGLSLLMVVWLASLLQTAHDYRVIERWFYQNQTSKLNNERFDLMYQQLQPIRAFSPLAVYADNQLLSALPTNRDSLKEKLEITARLLKTYNSPALAYNYATLLALDGKLDAAKAHLNNAFLRHPSSIDMYWQRTVKLTLNGEPQLFPLVKHIELLRDGTDAADQAPKVNGKSLQFPRPVPANNMANIHT